MEAIVRIEHAAHPLLEGIRQGLADERSCRRTADELAPQACPSKPTRDWRWIGPGDPRACPSAKVSDRMETRTQSMEVSGGDLDDRISRRGPGKLPDVVPQGGFRGGRNTLASEQAS